MRSWLRPALAAALVLSLSVLVPIRARAQAPAAVDAKAVASMLDLAKTYLDAGRPDEAMRILQSALDVIRIQQAAPSGTPVTPVAAPLGAPLRIGGDVTAPMKITDVAPAYPAVARDARVQGRVILEVTLNEAGEVADVRVLRPLPMLDQAAIDAVRQWRYTPTLLNGVPQPVVMTVTVDFSLDR
jgi:protein TonB